jgi:hypothetical protein
MAPTLAQILPSTNVLPPSPVMYTSLGSASILLARFRILYRLRSVVRLFRRF